MIPLPINRSKPENFESDWSDSRTMDSPDQYMNIVYKPCGFAERTRPRMIFPTQVGINPYARNSKQRLTAG